MNHTQRKYLQKRIYEAERIAFGRGAERQDPRPIQEARAKVERLRRQISQWENREYKKRIAREKKQGAAVASQRRALEERLLFGDNREALEAVIAFERWCARFAARRASR